MDPHIFADPDPGSQNLVDPTDPDPKNSLKIMLYCLYCRRISINRLIYAHNFISVVQYPNRDVKKCPVEFLTYCR